MRIAVLGTGMVGQAVGGKLAELGHQVRMGSRRADNPGALEWAAAVGNGASVGTFADAAEFGEIVVNATGGAVAMDVLRAAGARALAGKVLLDIANPLDFGGDAVSLSVVNTDSLGEQVQREFPEARVVKGLNTLNASVMVEPGRVPGEHNLFVCGNEAEAKKIVVELLVSFGWAAESIIDLGDITAARGTEMLLPLWLRLMGTFGHADFNFQVQRAR
ncbi:NAD(P)-binding domain-containing protein [Kutzneria viridogrisea]|uniref:Pyrroline-5-carboxylate reductase catalytic N-terminal domain-containing protein n=1 Tax=Kutzneria viridogrisea TaxID=47990 RepID=A0ABR6BK19_9PSEU|nr:hypothetical protein [Kutzneria viridogrisea]